MRLVNVLIYIHQEKAELRRCVATELLLGRRSNGKELAVIMANRRGGGQNIGVGCTDPIVEKIMNMPGEDRLNLEVSDKFDEPRSRRFGNIVVMFSLIFVMEKQRVVLEKKSAFTSAEF